MFNVYFNKLIVFSLFIFYFNFKYVTTSLVINFVGIVTLSYIFASFYFKKKGYTIYNNIILLYVIVFNFKNSFIYNNFNINIGLTNSLSFYHPFLLLSSLIYFYIFIFSFKNFSKVQIILTILTSLLLGSY
jgi:hypothetical protein